MFWYIGIVIHSPGQQVPDTSFRFNNSHPEYAVGRGPLVLIDRAHYNFHTREGGFLAFARLLEHDGFRVGSSNVRFDSSGALQGCRILVIANALNATNTNSWTLPTPSAFTDEEIYAISTWVKEGGRLLLIADHMPFAGAASALAASFGVEFLNGFAFTAEQSWPPSVFTMEDHTLGDSPVTTAPENAGDKINSVTTFTGSAFKVPGNAIPLLIFKQENWALSPDTAWRFNPQTPRQSLAGYLQGAILTYGKGKVAIFSEAAMFTAQIVNGQMPVGINSPDASQNARFVLNVIHWLDQP